MKSKIFFHTRAYFHARRFYTHVLHALEAHRAAVRKKQFESERILAYNETAIYFGLFAAAAEVSFSRKG